MPRIATSGQLTIGVNDVPPIPPRLVIVMPPPCMSSSDSLPARAFSLTFASSTDSSKIPLRSTSRITGTSRPRSVSAATPMWIDFLKTISFAPGRSTR